ncbi:MAG: grasp-with-spasm system ATP-grasp peptide maturase [Bacteroidales bacterium]|nr:grasp-with-spasm system ATP-grasp peptide maturase [Bacteroidales bacterium]
MMLIQSTSTDPSTINIIKWLCKNEQQFIRIDDTAFVTNINILDSNYIVELNNGTIINTSEITSYWYRRGEFSLLLRSQKTQNENFNKEYNNYIFREKKSLLELFIFHLKYHIYSIGDSASCVYVNKNINLLIAQKIGLNIPKFIVTTSKNDLMLFYNKCKNIITKSINESFSFRKKEAIYPIFTEKIDDLVLKNIPDNFESTLFQEEIQKKFEVRSFYLKGKFYSMAIFSQKDKQTKVDFRKYNDDLPNRNIPFKLPKNIELKLTKLMNELKYESGSIDIIYGLDNKFHFLEINPIGQFGMVSYPCNYYLEREICNSLINHTQNEK